MHQTRVRPPTEPYDIWCARRKMQQKALKEYLRGRPIWISNVLVDKRPKDKQYSPPRPAIRRSLISKDLKSVVVQGTMIAKRCFICQKKESKCKCWKIAL
jgi:hypothetical protein